MNLVKTYYADDDGQFPLPPPPLLELDPVSQSADLPPPPPPAPVRTNLLISLTPKPYKSPSTSTPVTTSPVAPVLSHSSPSPALSRPSYYQKLGSGDGVTQRGGKSLAAQIAEFALSPPEPSAQASSAETSPSSPRRESQWSVSPAHGERRVLGLLPDSVSATPSPELPESSPPMTASEEEEEEESSEQEERTRGAPTVTFGGPVQADTSSKSIAKMILESRRTPLPLRKRSQEEQSAGEKNLSDGEDKIVPLTFRRNSSSDSQESESLTFIPAKMETRVVNGKAGFSVSPALSEPSTASSEKSEEKYELVRAVPYRETSERKFSGSDTSSKSIAKMILNKKKNSFDEGRKVQEVGNSSNNNHVKDSANSARRNGEMRNISNDRKDPFEGGFKAETVGKSSDDKRVSFETEGRKESVNKDDVEFVNKQSSTVVERSRGPCSYCLKPVGENGVSAGGRNYHRECFKCYNCRDLLTVKFYIHCDQPHCETCYKAATCPTCSLCGTIVDGDGVKIGRDGENNQNIYHMECVRCSICQTVIHGKIITLDDKFVCSKCSLQASDKTCGICSKPVIGDCLLSDGKYFHKECMKCSVCGESLHGTYFTFLDKLVCERDYKLIQKTCSDCGCLISDVYYTLENGLVVCERDYKKLLDVCARCSRPVEGKLVRLGSSVYHPECFTCTVCAVSLVGVPFHVDSDNNIYCDLDFKKKYAAVCSVCRLPILPRKGEAAASRLRALGRDFHPGCFRCEDCGTGLDSTVAGRECYPLNNRPYCKSCCTKRIK